MGIDKRHSDRFSLGDIGANAFQFSASWGPELEEAIVMEALRRGANETQLFLLVKRWESQRIVSSAPKPLQTFSLGVPTLNVSDFSGVLISRWAEAYRNSVRQEYAALPADVQASFKFEKREPFAYYLELRPAYYCAGFDNPAETIFQKIKGDAKLLTHTIGGGVHETFAKALADLPRVLEGWQKGLAAITAKQIKSAGGFVPRFIAPKQGHKNNIPRLSNHASGCAVDIDAASNPHIKDAEVIEILRVAIGYDFGKPFVMDTNNIPNVDVVAQTHLRASDASQKLQAWLRQYLPMLDDYLEDQRVSHKGEGGKPLLSEFRNPAPTCTPLDAPTMIQIERLKTIMKYHSRADLEHWAKQGIQTIPLVLAAAFAELRVQWGTCYKDSKDMMHFEQPLVPPSPKRTLDDLFGWAHVARDKHRRKFA